MAAGGVDVGRDDNAIGAVEARRLPGDRLPGDWPVGVGGKGERQRVVAPPDVHVVEGRQ